MLMQCSLLDGTWAFTVDTNPGVVGSFCNNVNNSIWWLCDACALLDFDRFSTSCYLPIKEVADAVGKLSLVSGSALHKQLEVPVTCLE